MNARALLSLNADVGAMGGWRTETPDVRNNEARQIRRNDMENERISTARTRLEYLRAEIRAERISYGEIAELQSLAPYIEPGDTELLAWAGVPEHRSDQEN